MRKFLLAAMLAGLASGCYTVLRHPEVTDVDVEGDLGSAYAQPVLVYESARCAACHGEGDWYPSPYPDPWPQPEPWWWRHPNSRLVEQGAGMKNDRPPYSPPPADGLASPGGAPPAPSVVAPRAPTGAAPTPSRTGQAVTMPPRVEKRAATPTPSPRGAQPPKKKDTSQTPPPAPNDESSGSETKPDPGPEEKAGPPPPQPKGQGQGMTNDRGGRPKP